MFIAEECTSLKIPSCPFTSMRCSEMNGATPQDSSEIQNSRLSKTKLRAAAARDIKRNRTAGDRINSNCWEGDRFSSLAKIVGVSAWYASLASFRLEGRPFADIRCVKTRDRSEIAQERQPARFGYRLDVQDVALGETIELRKEIELPACNLDRIIWRGRPQQHRFQSFADRVTRRKRRKLTRQYRSRQGLVIPSAS